jgi:hypothetical protein
LEQVEWKQHQLVWNPEVNVKNYGLTGNIEELLTMHAESIARLKEEEGDSSERETEGEKEEEIVVTYSIIHSFLPCVCLLQKNSTILKN